MAGRKETVAADVAQEKPGAIGEIGKQAVELQSERDLDLEAFMEDILTIRVTHDNSEGALRVISPEVNSVQQPIIRGVESKVRRKYVEALARSRITTYDQLVQNPAEPANIQMVPKTVLTNDFVVLHDPHPHGREWLENILSQP